jgi:hypothetical protein
MNRKQWCALKGAFKDTFGIWGMLAGVFVAAIACAMGVIFVVVLLFEYLATVFPIMKEPIPPEFFTYGIVLLVMSLLIRAVYLTIKASYNKHMKKCQEKEQRNEDGH